MPRVSKDGSASDTSSSSATTAPRPMNCWMIFRKEMFRYLRSMEQDEDRREGSGKRTAENLKAAKERRKNEQGEYSRIIGKMWAGMSEQEKEPWRQKAREAKRAHAIEYPGYRYQPVKKEVRLREKAQRKVAAKTRRRVGRHAVDEGLECVNGSGVIEDARSNFAHQPFHYEEVWASESTQELDISRNNEANISFTWSEMWGLDGSIHYRSESSVLDDTTQHDSLLQQSQYDPFSVGAVNATQGSGNYGYGQYPQPSGYNHQHTAQPVDYFIGTVYLSEDTSTNGLYDSGTLFGDIYY